MNILIYRYGSICEPDFITGFLELGNHVKELSIEKTNTQLSIPHKIKLISKELNASPYDFVFSINFFPFLSDICNIYRIRYICMTVDSPVMELFSHSIQNPWNRIFVFDMQQYQEVSARNPDCVFYLPLATNTGRWDTIIHNASSETSQKYSSEVSFVGSLYTERCPYDRLQNTSGFLAGYLQGLINAQMKIYGYHFLEEVLSEDIVSQFRKNLPGFYTPPEGYIRDDRIAMVRLYLDAKISAMERVHVMQLIGECYPMTLYTGSDTSNLPVQNKGFADSLTEMPLIFHNSKINLNITSKSIREGLPLRIFDVLGCGGFLITNYQNGLNDIFTPGEDLEIYTGDDDLLQKIDYYLCHPNDRKEIAQNGYNKVKQYHNYPQRILSMLALAYDCKI